ncbi:DUF4625 domain-containing protein [Flammeovirga yaeyamensis]|uniref:DUF4625 domain-containing protein n=1 Tax=Flammeovirga yaeyamensis TaxID=367791 RepID=A0AAX1MZR5_9BACT|nr:DUF4625 domain-containing protein [Flammeovirga yaeyamensis]MBB3700315.1 hypothetical protein [Flammeovirga yaeyamensis]NMF37059.1 DUF4625 domain-containing protein [Flammeovirga yaeyamensis]QWG00751.1 DUF4625 domain-containing protein [Flammeovirga yaeyamensis]
MKIKYTILALAFLGLVACNNDDSSNNPAPTIENYVVENGHDHGDHARLSEEDHAHIVPGEEAVVEADLKGTSLSYAQVDVHWGAGHEHSARVANTDDHVQWTQKYTYWFGISQEEAEAKGAYNYALTAAGDFPNEHHLHVHMDVPTTWTKDGVTGPVEEGDYHFVLFLVDQEGQRTEKALTVEVAAEDHEPHASL